MFRELLPLVFVLAIIFIIDGIVMAFSGYSFRTFLGYIRVLVDGERYLQAAIRIMVGIYLIYWVAKKRKKIDGIDEVRHD